MTLNPRAAKKSAGHVIGHTHSQYCIYNSKLTHKKDYARQRVVLRGSSVEAENQDL